MAATSTEFSSSLESRASISLQSSPSSKTLNGSSAGQPLQKPKALLKSGKSEKKARLECTATSNGIPPANPKHNLKIGLKCSSAEREVVPGLESVEQARTLSPDKLKELLDELTTFGKPSNASSELAQQLLADYAPDTEDGRDMSPEGSLGLHSERKKTPVPTPQTSAGHRAGDPMRIVAGSGTSMGAAGSNIVNTSTEGGATRNHLVTDKADTSNLDDNGNPHQVGWQVVSNSRSSDANEIVLAGSAGLKANGRSGPKTKAKQDNNVKHISKAEEIEGYIGDQPIEKLVELFGEREPSDRAKERAKNGRRKNKATSNATSISWAQSEEGSTSPVSPERPKSPQSERGGESPVPYPVELSSLSDADWDQFHVVTRRKKHKKPPAPLERGRPQSSAHARPPPLVGVGGAKKPPPPLAPPKQVSPAPPPTTGFMVKQSSGDSVPDDDAFPPIGPPPSGSMRNYTSPLASVPATNKPSLSEILKHGGCLNVAVPKGQVVTAQMGVPNSTSACANVTECVTNVGGGRREKDIEDLRMREMMTRDPPMRARSAERADVSPNDDCFTFGLDFGETIRTIRATRRLHCVNEERDEKDKGHFNYLQVVSFLESHWSSVKKKMQDPSNCNSVYRDLHPQ